MALDSRAWRDVTFAHQEVPRFIREVAAARSWTADQLQKALADEQTAWEAADAASYDVDLRVYWTRLADLVTGGPYRTWGEGGVAYAQTVIGALETLDAEAAQAYRMTLLGSVAGGLAAAAGDVAAAGKATVEKVTDPKWIWGRAGRCRAAGSP
ncbi:MAG: hypothetical protein EB057_03435 [Microbacteriaceae bacterium]|nr:hypothetical protein [Microbacteriaceae bacterium]